MSDIAEIKTQIQFLEEEIDILENNSKMYKTNKKDIEKKIRNCDELMKIHFQHIEKLQELEDVVQMLRVNKKDIEKKMRNCDEQIKIYFQRIDKLQEILETLHDVDKIN